MAATTTIRKVIPKDTKAAAANAADLRSVDFFIPHMLCWKLLGISSDRMPLAPLYFVYGVFVNIAVTLCYPLHVCWSMFSYATLGENLMNLTLCVTCLSCSLKFVLFVANRKKLREINAILDKLDGRIQSPAEVDYCRTIRSNARNLAKLFFSLYVMVAITAELSFLTRGERSLLYPAYFPLDWRNSTRNFYIANVYQFVGIFFQITQNYANDALPAMGLCLLSSHIKLLGIRVSSIGWANESPKENEKELLECIKDQKNLYKLFEEIQEFLSLPMFFQVVSTGITTCLAMIIWMFFTTSPFDRLYYFVYFLSMPMEIFPTCYYGSDFQILFSELHHEIYASNWTGQSRSFKKNMILFTERSLKETTAIAGRMVRIHLNTFFSTIKGAYSLYAVINSMKK